MFWIELGQNIHFVQIYHSKITDNVKEEIKRDMTNLMGKIRSLVATSAGGMGVDFKGINIIINFSPPNDMVSFVQQLGMARTDSSAMAMAILLFSGRQCRNLLTWSDT